MASSDGRNSWKTLRNLLKQNGLILHQWEKSRMKSKQRWGLMHRNKVGEIYGASLPNAAR
jgi:hypothetical protein